MDINSVGSLIQGVKSNTKAKVGQQVAAERRSERANPSDAAVRAPGLAIAAERSYSRRGRLVSEEAPAPQTPESPPAPSTAPSTTEPRADLAPNPLAPSANTGAYQSAISSAASSSNSSATRSKRKERVQLEIAREAGFKVTEAPRKTASSSVSTETKTSDPTAAVLSIQQEIGKTGA